MGGVLGFIMSFYFDQFDIATAVGILSVTAGLFLLVYYKLSSYLNVDLEKRLLSLLNTLKLYLVLCYVKS